MCVVACVCALNNPHARTHPHIYTHIYTYMYTGKGILLYYAYRPLGSEARREAVARWYEEIAGGALIVCFFVF